MALLFKRLKAVASLVDKGSFVADIGCDHARLAVYLVKEGIANRVIATDLREKPLKNAAGNILSAGLYGKIETRLCDGFSGILKDEIDTGVIAGMGGVVIAKIIENAPWLKEKRTKLVLQPMTSAEYLRKYLCDNGFYIGNELTVEEDGKIYTVMPVRYDGTVRKENLTYLYAGRRDFTKKEAKQYAKKLYLRLMGEAAAWQNNLSEYNKLCEDLYKLSGEN